MGNVIVSKTHEWRSTLFASTQREEINGLIYQAYKEKAQRLLTYAPTARHSSHRDIFHVEADSLEHLVIFFRDIVQADSQAQ